MKNFIKINRALVAKKKTLLMMLLCLLGMGAQVNAEINFLKVKGQDIKSALGSPGTQTKVDNIAISRETASKITMILYPDVNGGNEINIPDDKRFIHYIGDEINDISILIPQDITINCKDEILFIFDGKESSYVNVEFSYYDASKGDVTLTLNVQSEYQQSIFSSRYARIYLNKADDPEAKLNINFYNSTPGGYIFNADQTSYVQFGYGDYNLSSKYFSTTNYLSVSGLGRFGYAEVNNYISTPVGAQFYSGSYYLKDCNEENIKGDIALKYLSLSTNWAYFDKEETSDYKLTRACDGLTLSINGAGDLSALDPKTLPWKSYADLITTVYVSSDMMTPLTKLPKGMCSGLKELKTVYLTGAWDLEEISEECFAGCEKLEEISFYMTEDFTKIGKKAFYDCNSLTTLELPETIEEIGDSAFFHCVKSEVTLPKSLKKVGFRAFNDCHIVKLPKDIGEGDAVESVERDENVGDYSFNVFNLTRLVFEGTLEEWLARDNSWIMNSWSYNNYSTGGHLNIDGKDIEDLVIPEGITEIKPYSFLKAVHIKTVKFPSTLTKIGSEAFGVCGLEAIDLPDNITELGEYCFEFCDDAVTLKLPKNLTVIPEGAFGACDALTDITWPEQLTTIEEEAFFECTSLLSLTLPETVTTLSHGAFSACVSLAEVTVPKNLKSLSPGAFYQCVSLKKVIVPSGMGDVEEINMDDVFKDLTEEEIALSLPYFYFPMVTEIRFGGDLDEWLGKSRSWLMKNVALDYEDELHNMVYQSADLYLGDSDEPLKDLIVPEGVTEIPAYAFRKTSVTSLTFSEEVTSIGEEAFAGCRALTMAETKAKEPAALGENAFKDIDENAVLKVYVSSVEAYEASDWAKYFKIEGAFAEYKITAASSDDALGEVTLTFDSEDIISKGDEPNSFVVGNNAKGHLVATPKDKYTEFVIWNDDKEDIYQAERDITVTGDFDYIATFHKDSFNVVVTVEGIDPELVVINGAGKYGRGDNVTLTFKMEDEHYDFEEWHFDKNNFEDEATLVFEEIDADHDVQIVFKAKYYTVSATVIPAEGGIVKGQGDYEYGSTYTLTLEPAEGWELKEWRDGEALEETSNVLTGLVYGDITIECVLQQKIIYYIVTFLDWDATLLLEEKVEEGKDAKGPDPDPTREGYKFVGWSKPITNITADLTVIAQYEKSGTGLEDVQGNDLQCTKVLRDGVLYLMYNGTMYDATGKLVK